MGRPLNPGLRKVKHLERTEQPLRAISFYFVI
jgi:hypothetical protein